MAYNSVNGSNNNGIYGENQYKDVNDGAAAANLTFYNIRGFKLSDFNSGHTTNVVNVVNSTELTTALTTLAATGGTINIAAGDYTIPAQLNLPSNIILQGAGQNSTVLNITGGHLGITAKHKRNIVIRDMTIDGDNTSLYGIYIHYCKNVLIERCKVLEIANSNVNNGHGIYIKHCSKITIRYCTSDGANRNGITVKDFDTTYATVALAEAEYISQSTQDDGFGDPLYGSLFTKEIIIHSNDLTNNGNYGLSFYGVTGEVAGNLIDSNIYGVKLSNAQTVSVHDNLLDGSAFAQQYGFLVENGYDMQDHLYSGLCIYNNVLNNQTVGLKYLDAGGCFISNSDYTSVPTVIQYDSVYVQLTTCSGSIEALSHSITVNLTDCTNCVPVISLGTASISVSIFNNGPNDADDVYYTFTISGLDITAVSSPVGVVSFTTTEANITLGALSNGSSVPVTITFSGPTGTYTGVNSVTTSSNDSDLTNNSSVVEITI